MSLVYGIFIAILTAVLGAVASGFVANLYVEWYRVSKREGAAGYFVLSFGVLGLIGGIIIGIVFACFAPETAARFFKVLGLSLGTVIALAAIACGISWILADIPPRIAWDNLFLVVEAQYPPLQTTSPATEPGDFYLTLGALRFRSRIVRKNVRGPIWREDAKLVDGRWIVTGAVEIFTGRGRRFLSITLGPKLSQGFIPPLPRRPGEKYQHWSNWLPQFPHDDPRPPAMQLNYRFRVQRCSEPLKYEKIGEFRIAITTRSFYESSEDGHLAFVGNDIYTIKYRGQPVTVNNNPNTTASAPAESDQMDMIATFPSPRPAMLVNYCNPTGPFSIYLLSEDEGKPKIEHVADSNRDLYELSPDAPTIHSGYATSNRKFLRPGLYRVGMTTVLDTRNLAVYRFNRPPELIEIKATSLGVSPDERSFISFAYINNDREQPALAAIDFVGDRTVLLPIDRQRMPLAQMEEPTPAWVSHYFIWERDPEGIDRLAERKDFQPLPEKTL